MCGSGDNDNPFIHDILPTPAVIRDAPGKNPTVGKRTQLVVWGRSFLPEVTCDSDLFLLMYDLSNGFMRRYSPALCDESTEGLWHSSLCVFGFEYFFEGGIAILPPGCSRFGAKPHSVWRLGKTVCTVSEFHAWCKEQSHGGRYSFAQYHILSNNCNHFTHQAVRFLLGGNDARTDHDLWRGIARSLPITRIQKNSHASSKKSSQPYDEPSTNQKRRPRGVKASSTVEREPFATSVDYVWCSAQNIQDLFCYLEDQTQLIQRSAFRFLRGTLENTMRGVQVLASQQRINFISHLCNKVIDLRKLRRYDVTVPHSVLIPTTDVLSSQISLSIWCDAHAGMQSEIWHIPPFTDWCPAARDDSDADVQTVTQKLQLCTSMYTQHLHEKPITPTHSSKPEQDDSHKKSCVLYTSFLSTLFHFCMGEGGVHFVLYLVHHEPIMEWITVLSESIWLHHPLVVRSLNCLLASLLIAPAGASFLLTNMRLYRGAVSSITLCIAGSEVFGPDNALLAVILMYNIVVVFRISVRVYGAYVNENHPIRMLQLASLALHLLNLKGIGNGSRHDYFVASFLCLTLLHTFLGQARAASTLSSWNLRGIVSRVQRQEQAIRLNDSMSQPTNTKSLSLPGGIGFGPPGESKAWAEESRRSSEEFNMSGLMQQFLEHSKCRTDISPEEIMFHSASSAVLGAVKSGFRARQD